MRKYFFERFKKMVEEKSLYDALSVCNDAAEAHLFIKDLLSNEEIERAENRWTIAFKHLQDPIRYSQSKLKQLGFGSSDKIGRIIRPTRSKNSGYRLVFERLQQIQATQQGEAE